MCFTLVHTHFKAEVIKTKLLFLDWFSISWDGTWIKGSRCTNPSPGGCCCLGLPCIQPSHRDPSSFRNFTWECSPALLSHLHTTHQGPHPWIFSWDKSRATFFIPGHQGEPHLTPSFPSTLFCNFHPSHFSCAMNASLAVRLIFGNHPKSE